MCVVGRAERPYVDDEGGSKVMFWVGNLTDSDGLLERNMLEMGKDKLHDGFI